MMDLRVINGMDYRAEEEEKDSNTAEEDTDRWTEVVSEKNYLDHGARVVF